MADTLNEELHADHRHWLSDLSLWRDDLAAWRKELARAMDEIRQAETALSAHAQAMDRHTTRIDEEERAVREHEQGIALVERGGVGWEAGQHVDDARHPGLRDAHERLKKHHHTVMARASLLLKAIAEPM